MKRKSMVRQVVERLHSMAAFGTSKHTDKAENGNKPAPGKIYSYSTMRNYQAAACQFAKWAQQSHGCKTLEAAREYTGEYLQGRTGSKSAWTVRRDAAALGKLYQCPTTELGAVLPVRHRADVTQHRTGAARGHFSESRNSDLVSFCKATGLRRHEVRAVTPEDVSTDSAGRVFVRVRNGKGGKARTVQALNSAPADIAARAAAEGRGTVFDHIPKYAPIHEYRADFARALYYSLARDPDTLPSKQVYKCRGDREGVRFDKAAMRAASVALGHNRLNVMTSYL